MSIIGVKGVPVKWVLSNVVRKLAGVINGHFEALNFCMQKRNRTHKICYLRLSEKLDPVRIVEKINNSPNILKAFIPEDVPDIPLAANPKVKRRMKLPSSDDNDPVKITEVMKLAIEDIMTEMQSKYPALYQLSKKTEHKVLEELTRKIISRMTKVMDLAEEPITSGYLLTKMYRRTHRHFGDFPLILSILHAVEDTERLPRTQIDEKTLSAIPPHPFVIGDLPYEKVQEACRKCSDKIVETISEHVKSLDSEVCDADTEDDITRKRVREELKKMVPFLPQIVQQMASSHFVAEKSSAYRIRIYGEPILPGVGTMSPFLRRYGPVNVVRSTHMYNMLTFTISPKYYAGLMAMDGSVLIGAKLIIRAADMPMYDVYQSAALKNFQFRAQDVLEAKDDHMEEDPGDDWTEAWD